MHTSFKVFMSTSQVPSRVQDITQQQNFQSFKIVLFALVQL